MPTSHEAAKAEPHRVPLHIRLSGIRYVDIYIGLGYPERCITLSSYVYCNKLNMFRRITLLLPFLSFVRSFTQAIPTDDCPILGPSFPSHFDPSSTTAIRELQSRFPAQLESVLSSGGINRTHTSFSINVFSAVTNTSLFSYHHAAPGLNGTLTAGVLNDDTIYRIGSVSKLFSVYAILVNAGMEILHHPVTRYLPELAGNAGSHPLERISWEEVTVGALASHLAGTGAMREFHPLLFG